MMRRPPVLAHRRKINPITFDSTGGLNDVARWRRPVAAEHANGRHVTKPQSPSLSRTRRPVLPIGNFSPAAAPKK